MLRTAYVLRFCTRIDFKSKKDVFPFSLKNFYCLIRVVVFLRLWQQRRFLTTTVVFDISAHFLLKKSFDFLKQNLDSLVGTKDWKEMVLSNPDAVRALFSDSISTRIWNLCNTWLKFILDCFGASQENLRCLWYIKSWKTTLYYPI